MAKQKTPKASSAPKATPAAQKAKTATRKTTASEKEAPVVEATPPVAKAAQTPPAPVVTPGAETPLAVKTPEVVPAVKAAAPIETKIAAPLEVKKPAPLEVKAASALEVKAAAPLEVKTPQAVAKIAPSPADKPAGPFRPVDPPLRGEAKFLSLADLPGWLAELAASRTVFAPRKEGAAVVYRPFAQGGELELALRPTESAKSALFPRGEELFRFERGGDPESPDKRRVTLQEPAEPGESVIFGALSCDARGFFAFDPVYDGCGTQGVAKDGYYLKRREKTTLIARPCRAPLSTCFCHWTGGGPASTQGADMLATDVEGGLLLQAVTEKGEALLSSPLLQAADPAAIGAAAAARAAVGTLMGEAPDLSAAPAALPALFDNKDFWQGQSAGCLSCGACTYLCPTCYCFNITDESDGISGLRLRSWDTCMSALFTLEASGHNPRAGKAARLRNRVGHKFSYYPGLHGGRFSCSGCGRCIKSCPSSVDIRKIVKDAVKAR